MFKIGSFEEELMMSMDKQLIANEVEEVHGFKKLTKAADLLSSAASLLDEVGLLSEAEDVVALLEKLS